MKKIESIKLGKRTRIKVQTINEEPSLTQQAFAEDCDVNIILDRYMKTGEINLKPAGIYADVSEIPDLTKAVNDIQLAQAAFDSLDARVRFEFNNDPVQLLKFLQDPKNKQKGIELGLLKASEQTEETKQPKET